MCWAVKARRNGRESRGLRRGFTLVELLIILGIIAVLLSLLLPALNAARRSSNAIRCGANVRSICMALTLYASDHCGRFPPNLDSGTPPQYWYDEDRAGKYLSKTIIYGTKNGGGVASSAVLACPSDPEADRAYSMNFWASSKVNSAMLTAKPQRGIPWNSRSEPSLQLILVTERWASTRTSTTAPWTTPPYMGYTGNTAGQRFGAGSGVGAVLTGRWGIANCELPYMRHRVGPAASPKTPKGSINIGYADGHVELKSEGMLADFTTGKSTLDSLWSNYDNDPAFNK